MLRPEGGRGRQGGRRRGGTRGSHHDSRNGRDGNRTGCSIGSGANTNSQPDSSPPAERLGGKRHRCKQRRCQWRDGKARITSAPAQTLADAAMTSVPGDLDENNAYVSQATSSVCDTGTDKTSKHGIQKWRSDSGEKLRYDES